MMKKENYLTIDFERIALEEFKFLQTDYGFSDPLFDRHDTFENIGYEKGRLGVLVSYDAIDRWCTIYFFDSSKGFPPEKHIIKSDYYERYKELLPYNPRELKLPDSHQKNGFLRDGGLPIEVSNNAIILKTYFGPILRTDEFIS